MRFGRDRGRNDHRQQRRFTPLYCVDYDVEQVGNIDGTASGPHDRSLGKAGSVYHVVKAASGSGDLSRDPSRTLFISGLDEDIDERTIKKACESYGRVVFARVVRNAGKVEGDDIFNKTPMEWI